MMTGDGAGPHVVLTDDDAAIDITGPATYVHADAGRDEPWPRCQAILYVPNLPARGLGRHVRTTRPVDCPRCLTGAEITATGDDAFPYVITRGGETALSVLT